MTDRLEYERDLSDEERQALREMRRVGDEAYGENVHQMRKWGLQNHPQIVWGGIEGEELGEVHKATLELLFANRRNDPAMVLSLRNEWVQVAAVALAAIECLDRQRGAQSTRVDGDDAP